MHWVNIGYALQEMATEGNVFVLVNFFRHRKIVKLN